MKRRKAVDAANGVEATHAPQYADTPLHLSLKRDIEAGCADLRACCRRCGFEWAAEIRDGELSAAYGKRARIPKSPSPATVIERVERARSLYDLAIGHVCVPPGFHPSIDDSATWHERLEALSAHFATAAIGAGKAPSVRVVDSMQLPLMLDG